MSAGDRLVKHATELLAGVPDPEIPVLNIVDLGIVRWVRGAGEDEVVVGLTPTYTGCPATEVISANTVRHLARHGITAAVEQVLSPPWSTDSISHAGRAKLHAYGIAPPSGAAHGTLTHGDLPIACPRCDSVNSERVSEYGSTPCKALYKCSDCLEPFEYFKCI